MASARNATHWKGPLLGSAQASDGLFADCPADDISQAKSRYKTWFEDFSVAPLVDGEVAGAGAVLTDINTATAPTETVDPANGYLFINPGSKADSGSQLQFTGAITGGATTPVFKTPGTIVSTATLMDARELIWATRIGIQSSATLWNGKLILGWLTIDTSLMSNTTGLPTVAAGGGAGFHLGEDGSLSYFSTNAAITAAGTALTEPNYGTAGDLTAATFEWLELGFRIKWIDASAGTGTTFFYVNGKEVGTITGTQPMDSTESYATSFGIHNGPSNTVDLAVDWIFTGITRPGLTNSTAL